MMDIMALEGSQYGMLVLESLVVVLAMEQTDLLVVAMGRWEPEQALLAVEQELQVVELGLVAPVEELELVEA